jgi:hypothetical protein
MEPSLYAQSPMLFCLKNFLMLAFGIDFAFFGEGKTRVQ